MSSEEPFHRLFNQGYIQAYAFRDPAASIVQAADVVGAVAGGWRPRSARDPSRRKMGKSLNNVVTPDDMYEAYGADTFRMYEMAMGPWMSTATGSQTISSLGVFRFLQRLWRNVIDERPA